MKIYKAMASILADFPVVTKDQKHSGYGESYSYRGIDDALAALHPLLAKHGVFMTLCDLEPEYHDGGTTAKGKALVRCVLTGKVRFFADDGSFVEDVAKPAAAPARTKKAPAKSVNPIILELSALTDSKGFQALLDRARVERTRLPSDSPDREAITAAVKAKAAEFGIELNPQRATAAGG
jgi:hypothetical protein